jgi:hypothetical protein
MDFGALDLRKAADKEYWVHLRRGDVYLYQDMEAATAPYRVKVASIAKPGVLDAVTAAKRVARLVNQAEAQLGSANRQQRAELESRITRLENEAVSAIKRFLMDVVLDWENIQADGKDVPFSRDMLDDWSDKGGPLFVLFPEILEDVDDAASPFGKAGSV